MIHTESQEQVSTYVVVRNLFLLLFFRVRCEIEVEEDSDGHNFFDAAQVAEAAEVRELEDDNNSSGSTMVPTSSSAQQSDTSRYTRARLACLKRMKYVQGSAKKLWSGFVNAAGKSRQKYIVSKTRNKIHQTWPKSYS